MIITFRQSKEDVIAASRMVASRMTWFFPFCWFFVALLQFPAIRRAMADGATLSEAIKTGGGGFVLLLLAIFLGLLLWLQPRLTARKAILRQVTYAFSESAIQITSEVADTSLSWTAFVKFKEGRNVFLLYVQKNMAQFIPKRALTLEQQTELRDLLKRHVKAA